MSNIQSAQYRYEAESSILCQPQNCFVFRSYSSDALGSMETLALRDVYKNKFLPRTYMDTYGRLQGMIDTLYIEKVHRILQTGKLHLAFLNVKFSYFPELYLPQDDRLKNTQVCWSFFFSLSLHRESIILTTQFEARL